MQLRKRNVFDVLESLNGNRKSGAPPPTVLVRVDFNVPMNYAQDGSAAAAVIADDSRIRGALPTIQAILHANCNVILVSHMGRPKLVQSKHDVDNKERTELSLCPVAKRLEELLKLQTDSNSATPKVLFCDDCMGEVARQAVDSLDHNTVLLLENLRFYKQEEKNDEAFASTLASYADAFINDAFGTCHRAHASTAGIPHVLSKQDRSSLCGIGCLVASELEYLDFSTAAGTEGSPSERIAAIIGGSKVSTKLPVIRGILNSNVDTLVLGGGLAFTFLKSYGINVGTSLVEDSMLETAQELMKQAKEQGKTFVLPVDAVCAQSFPKGNSVNESEIETFDLVLGSSGIADGWMGLDVGPKTVALFQESLGKCSKIVFNGPMGVFEVRPFDQGTKGLVDILVDLTSHHGCVTVVGGGDSVSALEAFGKTNDVSYVSTGGGATLELLAGDKLPGVEAIDSIDME